MDSLDEWTTHLEAFSTSLAWLTAVGYSNYANSLYLYLQRIINLENINNEAYLDFKLVVLYQYGLKVTW